MLQPYALLLALAVGLEPVSAQEAETETEPESPGPAVLEADVCAQCHSNAPRASAMRDGAGRGVAPFDLWRGTMMANAARDPLWRAFVSAEVAAAPDMRAEIEETCISCHAPMAHRMGLEEHGTGSLLHSLDCDSRLGELAREGVSCTVCHGMSPEGLGSPETFSGRFDLDPQRRLFGPHPAPFAMPMRMHTGFTPTPGEHVRDSVLCASCHTLETEVYGSDGHPTGASFLEQAPYLEWLNSDFRDGGSRSTSCQDCHVPTRDAEGEAIRTRIARNPGGGNFPPTRPREPYGEHTFLGGNTLVLSLLRDHPEELRTDVPAEVFQRALDATRRQLGERTARVVLGDVRQSGAALSFAVRVENRTGHKFPTAHPTRRAWLHVAVRDALGQLVFLSGGTDAAGRLVDGAGRVLPSELAGGPIEPHRQHIRSESEVAIYEAVPADTNGKPTHTLLRGAAWWIDDRLLPAGWSESAEGASRTAPIGIGGDADFTAGSDTVRYELELDGAQPYTIEATLLYQTLGARWAAELRRWETPDIELFWKLYEAADRSPEVIASDPWPPAGS